MRARAGASGASAAVSSTWLPKCDELLGLRRGRRELEVGRRVVGRVAAEDDERLRPCPSRIAATSSASGRGDGSSASDRLAVARRSCRRCRARRSAPATAACTAAGCRGPATIRPLPRFASRSSASAVEPRRRRRRRRSGAAARRAPARPAQLGRERGDEGRRSGALGSRRRWSAMAPVIEKTALDRPQPVHRRRRRARDAAPGGEAARVARPSRGSASRMSASSARITFALSRW